MNDAKSPPNQNASTTAEAPTYHHTRNGKVARLPKKVRDRICEMMLDGRTYLEIIAELGEAAKDLNEDNLSNWKSGGYLEWRREEIELSDVRKRQEYAADMARETEGTSLCEATSKMLLAQIMDALRHGGATSLESALGDKPEIYVRLLHAVSRLSASAIACERHRVKELERKAEASKTEAKAADRSISATTLSTVEELLKNH